MDIDKVRFTSSPWGFRETPFVEQYKWLKNAGINHICTAFSAEYPGLFDLDMTDEQTAAILKQTQDFGLKFASINGEGDFMVKEKVEDQIAFCCRTIDQAAVFSPQIIIVFAGWQDRDEPAVYEQVGASLKQVAQYAAKYNFTVALENHGGLTTTAEQINRILSIVNEPNIGINYDPANFLMYGVDPLEALKELKHPVVFTHFKSLKESDGKKTYCRLSEGRIDYLPILQELSKSYNGFYAIEYEETADVFDGSADDLMALKELLRLTDKV